MSGPSPEQGSGGGHARPHRRSPARAKGPAGQRDGAPGGAMGTGGAGPRPAPARPQGRTALGASWPGWCAGPPVCGGPDAPGQRPRQGIQCQP